MDIQWRRRLARTLSLVENREPEWREVLAKCYAEKGNAQIVGISGPPGVGKSTLIDALAVNWAERGDRLGIIAIDPASPFSGGAVLGDRIRMQRSEAYDGIFLRSMSARGYSGGLNEAIMDICAVLSSFGITRILLESVGAGQNDVDIAFVADCTLVLSVPGLGDSIQAAKAGLMEVGDIYVVNKGDLPNANSVAGEISTMLSLVFTGNPGANYSPQGASAPSESRRVLPQHLIDHFGDPYDTNGFWHPPVLMTTATDTSSTDDLIETIEQHIDWLRVSGHGGLRQEEKVERQLRKILRKQLFAEMERLIPATFRGTNSLFEHLCQAVINQQLDPYTAADRILKKRRYRTQEA